MAIIKYNPWLEPFNDIERWFNNPAIFSPAVNVYETKDDVIVEASLAGVDPKDVSIQVEGDVLVIKGETNKESEVDDKNYYRKEVRQGSFFRSIPLPAHVIADKAKAESSEGLLKIVIPKAPGSKTKLVKIAIKQKN